MDIVLLVSAVKDEDMREKLKNINDVSFTKKINRPKPPPMLQTKPVFFKPVFYSEIEEAITGFCRIIKYTNHTINPIISEEYLQDSGKLTQNNNPENLELLSIEEGKYTTGKMNGYCRILDAEDGSCQVGFFNDNTPWGKYCKFAQDGSYELPEGLYEGKTNCCTKMTIANFSA